MRRSVIAAVLLLIIAGAAMLWLQQGTSQGSQATITVAPQSGQDVSYDEQRKMEAVLSARFDAAQIPAVVQSVDDRTLAVSVPQENLSAAKELLQFRGRFSARVPIPVQENDTLQIGNQSYQVALQEPGDRIVVDGKQVATGDTIQLSGGHYSPPFTYTADNTGGPVLSARVFTEADVLGVDTDSWPSSVSRVRDGWGWQFQIQVSVAAAQRLNDVLQAFPKGPQNLQDAQLVFYLDEKEISSLAVANTFQDQLIQNPVIIGSADTREAALNEMQQLKTTLNSGRLPYEITITVEE